jgi:hypothetical protein
MIFFNFYLPPPKPVAGAPAGMIVGTAVGTTVGATVGIAVGVAVCANATFPIRKDSANTKIAKAIIFIYFTSSQNKF